MKSITPTEKKILDLIAEGFSTPDMALALSMSKFTVMSHRRSLLKKFAVKNSAELVRRGIQLQIINIFNQDHKRTTNLNSHEDIP